MGGEEDDAQRLRMLREGDEGGGCLGVAAAVHGNRNAVLFIDARSSGAQAAAAHA
jgi:hypothetical protein